MYFLLSVTNPSHIFTLPFLFKESRQLILGPLMLAQPFLTVWRIQDDSSIFLLDAVERQVALPSYVITAARPPLPTVRLSSALSSSTSTPSSIW